MGASTVSWHGDQQESLDLATAIHRNCTCEFGLMGVRLTTCPPHKAMTTDQRFLDGLLWMRHMSGRLIAEEWRKKSGDPPWMDAEWGIATT